MGDGIDIDYSGSGSWYLCSDNSYAHELGHTMGLTHDRAHAGSSGSHRYSYGYGSDGLFGTIMSYINPGISLFSNPDISICSANVCGTVNDNNARSLIEDKSLISAFRVQIISHNADLNAQYFLLLN